LGVLLISHDLYQVYDIADTIYLMHHGEVVDEVEKADTTQELLTNKMKNLNHILK